MKKRTERIRLAVQIAFAALSNGYAAGFLQGKIYTGGGKRFCLPGLNCYSCPGALGACPLGALQNALAGRDAGFPLYVVGFLLAVGALGGRLVCGFLCPVGLVQDLLFRIPLGRRPGEIPGARFLEYLRYLILVLFVIVLPLAAVDAWGMGIPWFCKWICPGGTLMGGLPLTAANPMLRSAIGPLFGWKAALLVLFLTASLLWYRPFCRYVCPLGAIYGLMNPVSILRYRVDGAKCIGCGACRKACRLGIDPVRHPNDPRCIRCGACIAACPTGALTRSTLPGGKSCGGSCASCAGCAGKGERSSRQSR